MLKKFLPNDYVKNVFEITPEFLKERDIKGIITDLDNTLVEWDRPLATPELVEWFSILKKHGIKVVIVSNNNETRVNQFSQPLNIPYIFNARKPRIKAYKQALQMLGLPKDETIVVGDQLLTDVLGGNRAGFHTVLVVPVTHTDSTITKFNRMIERRILKWFNKKGLLEWEGQRSGK